MKILIPAILASLLLSAVGLAKSEKQMAKPGREPIYFDSINELADLAKLPRLRDMKMDSASFEIRFWTLPSFGELFGFVIQRSTDGWTGGYVTWGEKVTPIYVEHTQKFIVKSKHSVVYPIKFSSEWDDAWSRMKKLGIFTLPDSSQLPERKDGITILDGISYVIEFKKRGQYGTYHYSNPELQPWEEAKRIVEIIELLQESTEIIRFNQSSETMEELPVFKKSIKRNFFSGKMAIGWVFP